MPIPPPTTMSNNAASADEDGRILWLQLLGVPRCLLSLLSVLSTCTFAADDPWLAQPLDPSLLYTPFYLVWNPLRLLLLLLSCMVLRDDIDGGDDVHVASFDSVGCRASGRGWQAQTRAWPIYSRPSNGCQPSRIRAYALVVRKDRAGGEKERKREMAHAIISRSAASQQSRQGGQEQRHKVSPYLSTWWRRRRLKRAQWLLLSRRRHCRK